ncbi:MAG: serine protease [Terriglobia bacterium]|jgi:hypothetical protein
MSNGLRILICIAAIMFESPVAAITSAQERTNLTGEQLIQRVEPSIVLVLVGDGQGRVTAVGSGIVVGSKGALLVPYHIVKDGREVQVRLKNGDIYDRAELLGFDERRDVAALRIPTLALSELPALRLDQVAVGDAVYVVSTTGGQRTSVSDAILTAFPVAEEVPGAGKGYRLIQFITSAPVGANGGALIDAKGRALGIIVGFRERHASNYAIPLESVVGLTNSAHPTELGSGKDLQFSAAEPAAVSTSLSGGSGGAAEPLRSAHKLFIKSLTVWFKPRDLENQLQQQPDFMKWGMVIVGKPKMAELVIVIDRPLLTYDFTFEVTSPQGDIVFASGKVTAVNGGSAAPKIAKAILEQMRFARDHQGAVARP